MKKLGLLLVCTMVLSGCSPTNGIVKEKEKEFPSQEIIQTLVEEQENISSIPEDVKIFIEELKEIEKGIDSKNGFNYIQMVREDINRSGGSNFSYETGVGRYSDEYSKKEFKYLIEALDKTIAKGLKLYLDKNGELETNGEVKSTKIGRVWINIKTEKDDSSYSEHPDYTEDSRSSNTKPDVKQSKNNISLRIQIRDVKDAKYKELIASVITDDLTVDSIKVGKEKNLITLNNIEFKNENFYKDQKSMINYELFVGGSEIEKVKISIISSKGKNITDQDLKLLEKLSSRFDFKNGDIKIMEDIKIDINDQKNAKYTKSSDRFNFSYYSLEDKEYGFTRSITQLIIEKK